MELSPEEVRVLGGLVEKEATTPDAYPLSTNALTLSCNQRSSREPVVDYDERRVTAALVSLRERGLARTARGQGSRVYKHAHTLRDALGLGSAELAVLSVLMLRGPQTVGELRTRSERQHAFPVPAAVEETLGALARREEPLVRDLARQPGQKETRWRHLLGPGDTPAPADAELATDEPDAGGLAGEVAVLRDELAALRARIDELERRL